MSNYLSPTVELRTGWMRTVGVRDTSLIDTNLRGATSAEIVQAMSAFVRINGEVQQLEGDALRDWLLQAVRME